MDNPVNGNDGDDQYHEMFLDADGDIVLRGSDGVRFRTHIFTLRQSSVFFRAMFSLPQPSTSTQTITLEEDSSVIASVLLMVSNAAFPFNMVCMITTTASLDQVRRHSCIQFDDMSTVETILHFCEKYGMPGPMSIVRSAILRPSLSSAYPLQVHALACRYEWSDVAQATAMLCLSHDLTAPSSVAALRGISLSHYGRLLSLIRRRREGFRQLLDSPVQFNGSDPDYACRRCTMRLSDLTWKVLRMRLVEELDKCPDGSSIRGDRLRRWPEWVTCMAASHCSTPLFNGDGTRQNLIKALDSLPENLLFEDSPAE
jgi:hypothetical protein